MNEVDNTYTLEQSKNSFSDEIIPPLSSFDKAAIKRINKSAPRPDISHLPGSSGSKILPVVSHTYGFLTDLHGLLKKEYNKHGPIFNLSMPKPLGGKDLVVILGPDANRLIYQNENQVFSNYLSYGFSGKGLMDDNVLALDFNHHRHIRKTLQVAFKRPAIEAHMELMNPLIRAGVDRWPTNRPVKSMRVVKKLLLDVGATVFLGSKPGSEAEVLNEAFTNIVAGGISPLRFEKPGFLPFAKAIKGRKTLEDYIYRNIENHREEDGRDMFTQLCQARDEEGNQFSDQEICNQILFVWFAAHDTTTSALSSIFFALADNPDWQEELREEMFSLEKDNLEFDDIDKLYKAGLTFKEALRMYPPAPLVPRVAIKKFEFNGYTVPENTPILSFVPFAHHMPEYWSNPYKFDPMRFSPERAEEKKDFFQYTPFGGGIHKCLGLHFATVQGRMVLFNLLKQYRITKHPKMKKYKYNNVPLTMPTDGLPLKFTRI